MHYVLWKVNRANLHLMMADRSRFEKTKPDEDAGVIHEDGAAFAARHKRKV